MAAIELGSDWRRRLATAPEEVRPSVSRIATDRHWTTCPRGVARLLDHGSESGMPLATSGSTFHVYLCGHPYDTKTSQCRVAWTTAHRSILRLGRNSPTFPRAILSSRSGHMATPERVADKKPFIFRTRIAATSPETRHYTHFFHCEPNFR